MSTVYEYININACVNVQNCVYGKYNLESSSFICLCTPIHVLDIISNVVHIMNIQVYKPTCCNDVFCQSLCVCRVNAISTYILFGLCRRLAQ